jgi:hypothetical protein
MQDYFVSSNAWTFERPHVLVVACSDGRYQKALDEFLQQHLDIVDYDRMYVPGGPGALASSTLSYFRGDQFRQETAFLIERHGIERVVLIFHGPLLQGGPLEATCADYDRKMPYASPAEIHAQHEKDLLEILRLMRRENPSLNIEMFRAEVRGDHRVQFTPLAEPVDVQYLISRSQ